MDAQPQPAPVEDGKAPYSEDAILKIYTEIGRACLFAGLSHRDADDVAQDIWEWLLRRGSPEVALTTPWLSAVVRNFILRFHKRRTRHGFQEGVPLENAPEPQVPAPTRLLEHKEILDRVAAGVPMIERRMLILIREGHTVAEAARVLGVPRGSRAYVHNRLIEYARHKVRPR